MSGVLKGMLFAFLLIYFLSPIDLCPGLIDDFIVVLCGMGVNGMIPSRER